MIGILKAIRFTAAAGLLLAALALPGVARAPRPDPPPGQARARAIPAFNGEGYTDGDKDDYVYNGRYFDGDLYFHNGVPVDPDDTTLPLADNDDDSGYTDADDYGWFNGRNPERPVIY